MLSESRIRIFWKLKTDQLFSELFDFEDGEYKEISSLQNDIHNTKWEFLKEKMLPIITSNNMILDYGCGFGKYSKYFKRYLGVDINERVIEYCVRKYPKSQFSKIELYQPLYALNTNIFFSSECLQYNDDESILKILSSLPFTINSMYIYEMSKSDIPSDIITLRSSRDYYNLINENLKVRKAEEFVHCINNKEYRLTILELER